MNEPGATEPERRGLAGVLMRLLRRVAPKHAEGAERESREWFFVCKKCGTATSYAEVGAVRYGAYSRGKITRIRCPSCGVKRWHKVERRCPAPAD
jgi:rubrerythrin